MHLSNVRNWSSHTSVRSIRCQHTYCHASIFRVFIMCVIITEDDLDRPNRMTKMRLLLDKVPSDTNLCKLSSTENMFCKWHLTLHIEVLIFFPAHSNLYFGVQTCDSELTEVTLAQRQHPKKMLLVIWWGRSSFWGRKEYIHVTHPHTAILHTTSLTLPSLLTTTPTYPSSTSTPRHPPISHPLLDTHPPPIHPPSSHQLTCLLTNSSTSSDLTPREVQSTESSCDWGHRDRAAASDCHTKPCRRVLATRSAALPTFTRVQRGRGGWERISPR